MPVWVRVYLKGEGYETLRLNRVEDAENLIIALEKVAILNKDEAEIGNVLVYKEDD